MANHPPPPSHLGFRARGATVPVHLPPSSGPKGVRQAAPGSYGAKGPAKTPAKARRDARKARCRVYRGSNVTLHLNGRAYAVDDYKFEPSRERPRARFSSGDGDAGFYCGALVIVSPGMYHFLYVIEGAECPICHTRLESCLGPEGPPPRGDASETTSWFGTAAQNATVEVEKVTARLPPGYRLGSGSPAGQEEPREEPEVESTPTPGDLR